MGQANIFLKSAGMQIFNIVGSNVMRFSKKNVSKGVIFFASDRVFDFDFFGAGLDLRKLALREISAIYWINLAKSAIIWIYLKINNKNG